MPETGESGGAGVANKTEDKKQERKCPACGAVWTKTEPTLAAVRVAIQQEVCKYEKDLHDIEPQAELGYRGSVARGTVGNPSKPHYNYPPDIRGECGIGFDVDGFILSPDVYKRIKKDKFGKRWAKRLGSTRVLEGKIRASLSSRSELAHMKSGSAGFELLVRPSSQKDALFEKGGVLILIFKA